MADPSLDALPVAVARIDRDLRVVWANAWLADALERPREAVLGCTCQELGMAGEHYVAWAKELRACFENGVPGRFIHLAETRGEQHLLDYRFVPEGEGAERPEHVLAVAYVNQEAERLRVALASQHQRVWTFLEHAPMLAWLRDEEGRYRLVNEAYKQHYGVRDEDIVGRTVQERWPGAAGERFAEQDRLVAKERAVHPFLELAPHPDGTVHTFEAVKFPVEDASGALHVGGVALDVTHRMQVARTMGRLEEIRDLAAHTAGVVHDLANDAFVITSLLSVLEDRSPEVPLLADMRVAADRVVARLREIRERPAETEQFEGVSMAAVVAATLDGIGAALRPEMSVVVEPPAVDVHVRGAASALQRVIENLLLNASDAEASQVRLAFAEVTSKHGTRMVVLSVADDGPGIAPALRPSLFEPFSSTKGARRGLGLAGARAVVRRHGGELRLRHTPPGQGATFELRIPAFEPSTDGT